MTSGPAEAEPRGVGPLKRIPLYVQILVGMALGVVMGVILGPRAGFLGLPAELILRMLSALAPPLILVAVIQALSSANISGPIAGRLVRLLLLNTVVAIAIGLTVANVVRPGQWSRLAPEPKKPLSAQGGTPEEKRYLELAEKFNLKPAAKEKDAYQQFLDNIPDSFLRPLVENKVLGVILIAVAVGIALRPRRNQPVGRVADLVDTAMEVMISILHWIVALVPLGVFGKVASIIGEKGFTAFQALGAFIIAVILALLLQAVYYLTRVQFGSWVNPRRLLSGCRDALVMAFSTASSTATMPVTYACLRERVGLRASSANLGALVGANFNNDGTALYEAMSALFISQMLGQQLDLGQQFIVVVTSVFASVGAAGIPNAGLVTMTLVFNAVHLPTDYIAILLTVDWFLDRCRTAINVMGDMNVSCLLDGKVKETPEEASTTVISEPILE